MVKPNGVAKATAASARAAAGPSKSNPSTPGSIKTSKFKKRKVKANREKAAAAAGSIDEVATVAAGTAGGDASASADLPQPSHVAEASPVAQMSKPDTVAEASPVAQMPKPETVAEASPVPQTPKPATDDKGSGPASVSATDDKGSGPASVPATAEASVPKPKPAASKGNGMGAANSSGDGRVKRRGRTRRGKGKEVEEDGGSREKGKKPLGRKEERRGDNKGAGFIFMCNAKTKQECYQSRLFGLPGGKVEMVKKIRPGAKLFLYDFDLKLLYGVYKAASNGGLNLVREAFDGKFPAQVKFKIDKDCLPLPESSIKQAIKENYSARSKFDPELTARQLGHSLASVRDDHRRYYQPAAAPEPRHIPLALDHYHVPSVPELRHVPAAYHTLAPSSDSYYRSVENLAPERYADRTVADITARDTIIPRDYARLPVEISARAERLDDLYRTGGIAARGAHVEELYPPCEIAARADRVGIATRADYFEDLYHSDRLVSRAVDPLPRSTYHTAAYETNPAYAETSTRPVSARVNGPSVPVSSLYSFSGAPVYR
nr:unnamed protein product [Digitaria exilis]